MKKYLKVILIPLIFILIVPFLLSLINIFDIKIPKIIYLISIIIMAIITGFMLGTITDKKAYQKGIICGSILSLIMFLIALLIKSKFTFYTLIYYAIIIISTTFGSILGITKKG